MISTFSIRRSLASYSSKQVLRTPKFQGLSQATRRHGSSLSNSNVKQTGLAGETSYIAASAVFFAGLYTYLHSGNAPGKKSEHASHGFSSNVRDHNEPEVGDGLTAKLVHGSHTPGNDVDEEGSGNVKDSINRAISVDAPKSAYAAEARGDGSQLSSDVKDSISRGLAADAPKTAYQAEKDHHKDGWVDVGTDDSIRKSLAADAPKTAKKAEEESARASTAR